MQVQTPLNFINIEILSSLVSKYFNHSKLTTTFKEINELCHLQLKSMQPQGVIQIARKINIRQAYSSNSQEWVQEKETLNWAFEEFKIFIWVIIYEQLIHQSQLKDFTQEIIVEIRSIFTSKSIPFIRYEVKLLSSYKSTVSLVWAKEELHSLQKIMSRFKGEQIANWKMISFALFTESDCKYFRNLNHCREKWKNHLNPQVNKADWTVEEDILLFQLIERHGLKWSKISKSMENKRTEHMVKNRYNRYLRKWKTNKNKPISYIRNVFKYKIEKNYLKKIQQKQRTEKVKVEVLMQEESERDMESNDATIKVFSSDQMGNQFLEQNVKQQNLSYEYHVPKKEDQNNHQQPSAKVQNRWSYYPFLNLFAPQSLQTNHTYRF